MDFITVLSEANAGAIFFMLMGMKNSMIMPAILMNGTMSLTIRNTVKLYLNTKNGYRSLGCKRRDKTGTGVGIKPVRLGRRLGC